MNAKEIAKNLRTDVADLEALIKKLQFRCDHLKWLAEVLEAAANPKPKIPPPPTLLPESKIRKLIDKVYGEKSRSR